MDRISPAQFKRWKSNAVGKVFFKYLEDNIELKKLHLEQTAKNPSTYSQEDYYKKCLEIGIVIRTWQELMDVKIDFIQGDEDDNTDRK